MDDLRANRKKPERNAFVAEWVARLVVFAVFSVNVSCAAGFLISPDLYAPSFELSGLEGRMVVQGFGILFLMWNATYPLVLVNPRCHKTLFVVILAQQAIGLIGESFLLWSLPTGHDSIAAAITRFAQFDGIGLVLMAAAFVLLRFMRRKKTTTT
jgi:hypothetical protein